MSAGSHIIVICNNPSPESEQEFSDKNWRTCKWLRIKMCMYSFVVHILILFYSLQLDQGCKDVVQWHIKRQAFLKRHICIFLLASLCIVFVYFSIHIANDCCTYQNMYTDYVVHTSGICRRTYMPLLYYIYHTLYVYPFFAQGSIVSILKCQIYRLVDKHSKRVTLFSVAYSNYYSLWNGIKLMDVVTCT